MSLVKRQVGKQQVASKQTSGTMSPSKQQVKICFLLVLAISATIIVALISAAQAEHHHEHKHKFNPYKYGYKVIDHKGNKQWKQEESHHPHEVKGSYGFKDKHGMFREVSYIADKHGFRAHVKTNEPGTAPKSSAGVKMDAHPEPSFHKQHHHGHEASHGHH